MPLFLLDKYSILDMVFVHTRKRRTLLRPLIEKNKGQDIARARAIPLQDLMDLGFAIE